MKADAKNVSVLDSIERHNDTVNVTRQRCCEPGVSISKTALRASPEPLRTPQPRAHGTTSFVLDLGIASNDIVHQPADRGEKPLDLVAASPNRSGSRHA